VGSAAPAETSWSPASAPDPTTATITVIAPCSKDTRIFTATIPGPAGSPTGGPMAVIRPRRPELGCPGELERLGRHHVAKLRCEHLPDLREPSRLRHGQDGCRRCDRLCRHHFLRSRCVRLPCAAILFRDDEVCRQE